MAEADLAVDAAAGQEAAADAVPQGQAVVAGQQAATVLLQPLLDALLAHQHAGLLRLLQAMHSSNKVISVLMATGICIFAQAVHTRLATPQTGAALVDAFLAQQQQGLSLVLQALHHELYPDAAANVLRCLAHAAPVRLLDALLSRQQRRGMQSLLRCLDACSEHASVCSRTVVLSLLHAAEGRPQHLLVLMLLRALQQGSIGAGQLVLSFSQMQAGPGLLRQHIKVLLELVAVQAPCQTLVAAALWSVANHSEESVAALAALNPQPLLQAMLQGGDPAMLSVGTIYLLALSDAGRRSLLPHISTILSLVAPQNSSLVCSMVMRTISLLCTAGSPDWAQQAVLQHIGGLLTAMSQQAHPDAAAAAGNVLLSLVHTPAGLHALSSEQHVDKLVSIVQSRGPATTHAARAVAQLASGLPAVRLLLVAPHHQAVIGGLHDILQELLLADAAFLADPFQAYQLLAPVYWSCVASAACQVVPAFLGDLVACLQRPELTLPAFEAVAYLTGFPAGLLGLAPHIRQVWQAVSAPRFAADAALQTYLSSVVAAVRASVQRLQREVADAQARRSHAAQMLAGLHAQHRRRPRTRGPLGKEVLLWLRCVARLQDRSEQLQQQLAVAQVAL
ncbi:hypothetical protein COO60DRAFT_743250 [Scenedesmus sp. NREL 46B-D3]|nr:hypothetical protein COO60DRAFT_743250 [Scenedesmus sp. NREL 46B-D3]